MRWGRLLAAALWLAGATAHADVGLRALRIDAENQPQLSPGGADATGGVGDWALTNGALCAIVADPSHESDLAVVGGGLVDLGHCGRADDQLVLLQPLANLDRRGAVSVTRVETAANEDEASIATIGRLSGCDVETRWILDRADPTRLRIATRVTRTEASDRIFAFGDVIVHAQHAVRPFGVDSRGRPPATGFAHPAVDLKSPLSVVRATGPLDTRILAGAQSITPGIGYALRWTRAERLREGAEPVALSAVSLSAENFSGIAVFASPFWLGADRLGPLQIAQTFLLDLAVGETLVYERELLVSDRADVASLTDRLFADTHRVRGRVGDPGARVAIASTDGKVATEAAVVDGGFAASLPNGAYRLTVLGTAGGETPGTFEVANADLDLGELVAPPLGGVAPPRGAPMRLVFLGIDGTPDPRFGDERPHVSFGAGSPPPSELTRDVSLAGVDTDPVRVPIAPGRYRVLAGRGPEYGVTEAELVVRPGETAPLAIGAPPRVLDTPGWISADLHVHAAPSDDSALPLAARVASFVAEGAEVLVATDHDHLTDYGPLIRELGLTSQVASVVGQEITSSVSTPEAPYTFGHANAFPVPYRPTEYRKGAIPNEGRRLRQVIDEVRALGGDRLIQLNHARSGGDVNGFFEHLSVGHGFEPDVPLDVPPNAVLVAHEPGTGTRDVDFDAMELLNGPSMERYHQLREDWFALLRHGEVRTGTANSDSHLLREPIAAPRNLVQVAGDVPPTFDPKEFVDAIRAGRVVGTTGPVVDAHVGDAGLGETHRGRDTAIRVDVHAAPWVPVSRVRVFVNGRVAHESDIGQAATIWFPHTFDRDAFVTVEVEGVAEPDSIYAARLPGFTPFAFTNPIFVDTDGDGKWTPPEPPRVSP
jgi:hypothetical protein